MSTDTGKHAPTLTLLRRVFDMDYGGGVNGTCYECPFASEPLERDGKVARWEDISNDPTEAYFRCSLPGRNNTEVYWGEYAPCTATEWWDGVLVARQLPPPTLSAELK